MGMIRGTNEFAGKIGFNPGGVQYYAAARGRKAK